jgi:glycosyltransferase involved in cell wall biosynthesis
VKVLLAVHGLPPELVGGTELAASRLAGLLAAAGHEVVVLAGSFAARRPGEATLVEEPPAGPGAPRVLRLSRGDLHLDHWHKSRSARAAARVRELLERERPDVLHVLHWLRLSRDLAALASQAGVPAVVSLNDAFVSCPLVHRVDPRTRAACERPTGPAACLPCAGAHPPRTPWVPQEEGFVRLAERSRDLERELRLARVVLAPTRLHGERQLALAGVEGVELGVAPPAAPVGLTPAPEPAPVGEGRPLVLGAWGRLSELKGTDLLLEALDGLGGVELRLAGAEERPGLLDSLRARHPSVAVSWSGPHEAAALGELPVAGAHAMVSASRAPESFGLVLDEARALGMPALLPDAGAFRERGGEERGAPLFAPGDAGALRAAVRGLRDDPARLAALRAAVPPPTTPEQVLSAHLSAYERAAQAGPPAPCAREWYEERLVDFAEEEWDRRCALHDPAELGLGGGR